MSGFVSYWSISVCMGHTVVYQSIGADVHIRSRAVDAPDVFTKSIEVV